MTQRLRLQYEKGHPVRWLGHLDVARFWERALRRADIPVVYSQGYNPQPKIQFASALPVGFSGRAELMDIWVASPQQPEQVRQALNAQCPRGFRVIRVWEVPLKAPALPTLVREAEYLVQVERAFLPANWREQVQRFLEAEEIWREKRRKKSWVRYNLRPLILDLRLGDTEGEWVTFTLRVKSEPGATGRPDEVLNALGWEDVPRRIERLRLILKEERSQVQDQDDGQRPEDQSEEKGDIT